MASETLEGSSLALFEAWRRGPSVRTALDLARQLPVPGAIALRGRFHVLTDLSLASLPSGLFLIDEATWSAQIELTDAADRALVANDVQGALRALASLRGTVKPDVYPLPVVDALVGLGDAARQVDDLESAISYLGEAVELAETIGYRFGRARALVSLGYVTMQVRSLAEASTQFESAAAICREIDERVYLANALIGLGEARCRLRLDDAAIGCLREAIAICESIEAPGGIVNASQHLGDLHRRRREFEPAREAFARALEFAERSGPWIGVVNAADGLGEVSIGLGDLDVAVRHYARAYEMSEQQGYVRGEAHALNGLGRCAYMERDWVRASDFHGEALVRFQRLEDLPSEANALDGLARVAEAIKDWPVAVRCRLAAVAAIEEMRSAQDRHDYQTEYRRRFEAVYSWGMRTALKAEDVAAFVAVFEGMAGRRLAGLIEALPSASLVDTAQLVSNLTAQAHHRPSDGADLKDRSRAERLARLLGRHALRGALPELAAKAVDDIAAALYRPFDEEAAAPLIQRVAARGDVLMACEIPGNGGEIAWARTRNHGAAIDIGVVAPGDAALQRIAELAATGLPSTATSEYLAPLADLLPEEAFVRSDSDAEQILTVIPLGALWAVPWPAIPVGESEYLGERFGLALAPSLTLADHVGATGVRFPVSVAHWRSPTVLHHKMQAFVDDNRVSAVSLASGLEALTAITSGKDDLIVITGHGRPVEGIGHYLELEPQVLLEPAALLTARTPRQLVLLACWGAHTPGRPASDPLTLATIALTRGSCQVAATVSELADDAIATRFVNNLLHRLPDTLMPLAIRDETRRFLSHGSNRRGPLSRWAPLVTVGASGGEQA